MAYRDNDEDDLELDDEDDGQFEGPDESDLKGQDEPVIVPCPHCRKGISEWADRCHHCGHHVVDPGTSPKAPSLLTMLIVTALVLLGLLGWWCSR